ncbi:MAG: hypothetical protein SX243_09785 [Acidobacteriota bacterium]|nr:hypothetical protein [Acidobacteriota bacterium]
MSLQGQHRRELFDLALRQAGYFTAQQALGVGYSYQGQKYHADVGNWRRVGRGLFRLPEIPQGEHAELVRWSLWARGEGAVSHRTAARLWGLLPELEDAAVDLTVPPGYRRRARGARLYRAEVSVADLDQRPGFRVTRPLRTVLDLAPELSAGELPAVLERALDRDSFDLPTLRRAADGRGAETALAVERAVAALRGDPFPGAVSSLPREATENQAIESEVPEDSGAEELGEDWRQW